jgi:hypothetical protein
VCPLKIDPHSSFPRALSGKPSLECGCPTASAFEHDDCVLPAFSLTVAVAQLRLVSHISQRRTGVPGNRVKVGPVGPDRRRHFWVNLYLVKQPQILQRAAQRTGQHRPEINHMLRSVIKPDPQSVIDHNLSLANAFPLLSAIFTELLYYQLCAFADLDSAPV